jgi:hypothetical protein
MAEKITLLGMPVHMCPKAPKNPQMTMIHQDLFMSGVCPFCFELLKEPTGAKEFMNPTFPEKRINDLGSFHGSPTFYKLLEEMAELHDKKSHDYASDKNPFGNYVFAGQVASMFAHSPKDAGFASRLADKLYRIANLESSGKTPKNEAIEDTEKDLCVIVMLWIAARKDWREEKEAALLSKIEQPISIEEVDKMIDYLIDLKESLKNAETNSPPSE